MRYFNLIATPAALGAALYAGLGHPPFDWYCPAFGRQPPICMVRENMPEPEPPPRTYTTAPSSSGSAVLYAARTALVVTTSTS
jgi:hypothetical protein